MDTFVEMSSSYQIDFRFSMLYKEAMREKHTFTNRRQPNPDRCAHKIESTIPSPFDRCHFNGFVDCSNCALLFDIYAFLLEQFRTW